MIHPGIPPEFLNQIVTGDAKELAKRLPDESVDLIFTDPPYPKEFLHTFRDLGIYGPRVLKDGGSLVTLCGHYQMDEVLDALRAHGLRWHWIGWLSHNGTMTRLRGYRIMAGGKPLLWLTKGKIRPTEHYVFDMVIPKHADKQHHAWAQPINWATEYISKLALPGEVVLDPFAGGGTTAAACRMLGRNYISFEINPKTAERARERVANTQPPLFVEQPEQGAFFP